VVVYSAYEHGSLQRLSASLPDLAPSLGAIMRRLVDLLPVVRTHVYHPGFAGSFSLKRVAPSLAPAVGYADLGEVADGAAASAAFARLARGEVQGAAAKALRADLLRYCERDTRALLELHRALRSLHAARRAS
jgi:predicted RecB family nuclease